MSMEVCLWKAVQNRKRDHYEEVDLPLCIIIFIIELFLNIITEFREFNDKIFDITVRGLEPATSCIRDQDATTAPEKHT